MQVEDIILWTDSTSVLQYMNNSARRFHVFVANRVVRVHAGSKPRQWRQVTTDQNPADIASRGLMPNGIYNA